MESLADLHGPLLPDVGVLALVPDTADSMWQPRHHVLSRLARFFSVVWLEPAQDWRTLLSSQRTGRVGDLISGPGFALYPQELWLPKLYRPRYLAELSFRQRLRRARRSLTAQGCRKIILYIWRPEFEPSLTAIPFDLSCYHIDDEYSFSPVDLPTTSEEARLIECADQIFVSSRTLLEKKGRFNTHVNFVPNGVDYNAYAKAVAEPADLANIPRPRIGYTGFLKKQLDWPLLRVLTKCHPEWSFVFVGPLNHRGETNSFFEELSRLENVHFLGAKSTSQLPFYPQHFDVCIMPYKMDDYTKYIYPTKLHEYLASGRPVVGARIPSLLEFSNVVALASSPDEWPAAISKALKIANDATQCEARRCVARQHDWNVQVLEIARTMAKSLGPGHSKRLEESLRSLEVASCQ